MSGFWTKLLGKDESFKTLARIAQAMGSDIHAAALKVGKELPGLVRNSCKKAGLPSDSHGYVFWLLVDEDRFWPPMHPDKKQSLLWAVKMMDMASATPPQDESYQLPEEADERKVEAVILACADWAHNSLRQRLVVAYLASLKSRTPAAAKLLGVSQPEAKIELGTAFLMGLKHNPRWFKDVDMLYWALGSFVL
jgi:hypothetical protein